MTFIPLFENDHFIAIDKPAGWLSVPSRMGTNDPRPCVGIALQGQLSARLWPIHRLDLEVSGVIVFAKSAADQRHMNVLFENRTVVKTYHALTEVRGQINLAANQNFVWESKLLRGKKRAYENERGKPSKTEGVVLENCAHKTPPYISWNLKPITGRPHQLRFEMAKQGTPIVGDRLYGSQVDYVEGAIALRCVSLAFPPSSGNLFLPELVKTEGLVW